LGFLVEKAGDYKVRYPRALKVEERHNTELQF
jgi:hypothetical protein